MSHIVIHDDHNDVTHYAQFDDLGSAAAYLEDLVNADAESNARLFALEPVEFAVKSYVKIEIGSSLDVPTPPPAPVVAEPTPVMSTTVAPADDTVGHGDETVGHGDDTVGHGDETVGHGDDTVEYVEAAMAPVDSYAPMADTTDGAPAGEVRRGLFGR
jgi:hypothetical protein